MLALVDMKSVSAIAIGIIAMKSMEAIGQDRKSMVKATLLSGWGEKHGRSGRRKRLLYLL